MRGCSLRAEQRQLRHRVVPAHAGMFPLASGTSIDPSCGPRACGDVPSELPLLISSCLWSPRMRGCSRTRAARSRPLWVVPAHAGMFPPRYHVVCEITRGPRACGDVPIEKWSRVEKGEWSPRMRGCSRPVVEMGRVQRVVPAHAGMFPKLSRSFCLLERGPRACGDVPASITVSQSNNVWSPRMRGCSRLHLARLPDGCVVPAHAGMFPR